MQWSHLHLMQSRKSHARQFLQNGVGRGYFVAVTGSDLHGSYIKYVAVTGLYMATFQ